jgi:ADP-ribose pyrophosphatase
VRPCGRNGSSWYEATNAARMETRWHGRQMGRAKNHQCALRELREETGFEGRAPDLLGVLNLNPSWQTTRVHVFLVQEAEPVGPKDEDEAEDIRVRLIAREKVAPVIRDGEIDSAVAISAFALFEWHARQS